MQCGETALTSGSLAALSAHVASVKLSAILAYQSNRRQASSWKTAGARKRQRISSLFKQVPYDMKEHVEPDKDKSCTYLMIVKAMSHT